MDSLGSLPTSYEQYKATVRTQLLRLLEHNAAELNRYTHVNKRAIDQFSRFTEKIEQLTERIQEFTEGDAAIVELLAHMEQVKDEAILKTFKSVAQHFAETFQELVPQGRGLLKLMKGEGQGVMQYAGVSINVSFNRADETAMKLQQLSGGQKTTVAIALICAIQRADPAPFYLFDELDAALDAQHRSALASLISRNSDRAQFIVTTFKPELCQQASKLFEVKFANKASHIRQIELPRAMEVIQKFAREARDSRGQDSER
jgi:structural maintenance of chromosome 3 (chondroitin sulfate proteoglycan 6)